MQSLYYKAFNYIENSKPNHLGIYFSLFLHLIILLFAIGLPDFFKPKKIPMPQVIPIEILNVSDVTSLTSKKENIEINKESKKLEQKKFTSSENTEIQKIDLNEKPKKKVNTNEKKINDTEMIKKPESKNITLKKKEINNLIEEKKLNVESVETLKVNKIKPKLKPKAPEQIKAISDVVIENKTKPEIKKDAKIIDKPKPVSKPEPDFNLATMLKDLRNEDISNTSNNNNNEEECLTCSA